MHVGRPSDSPATHQRPASDSYLDHRNFLSTLRYFFEGRRELFRGLHIDSFDWDWEAYPVLYLDLNTDRFAETGMLEPVLDRLFRDWEKKYGVEVQETTYSQRFSAIIEAAHRKTGKQVVLFTLH